MGSPSYSAGSKVKLWSSVPDAYKEADQGLKNWSGSDGKTYRRGAMVTVTGDLTLTANFDTLYEVQFYDGSTLLTDLTKRDVEGGSVKAPTHSKSGYRFLGWSITQDRANSYDVDYEAGSSIPVRLC